MEDGSKDRRLAGWAVVRLEKHPWSVGLGIRDRRTAGSGRKRVHLAAPGLSRVLRLCLDKDLEDRDVDEAAVRGIQAFDSSSACHMADREGGE